jgi:hypothetical protein
VVLGGAKVSDKLGVISNLLPKVDRMLIGGGMCFTFLAALGMEVGKSLFEEDMVDTVKELIGKSDDKIVIPTDVVTGDRFAEDAATETVVAHSIAPDRMGLDIGPETAEEFASVIAGAASVFWNGPMGVFEWEARSRTAPRPWPRRWESASGSPPSAVATRWPRSGLSGSKGPSPTSPPVAGPVSNCSKAGFCRESPFWKDG